MEYNFRDIEKKWQERWIKNGVYKVNNPSADESTPKPKCYVLDMFPYPSGVGLHVGHPLGFIASDIYSRYKKLKGFNVLHAMGYDAFGLPAEQYAIDHGIHPAVSTANNIANFRSQLDKIGFCFDWAREVNTSKPGFYKWTQWIFLQLFDSWYNRKKQKAERIETLVSLFEQHGNNDETIIHRPGSVMSFSSRDWKAFTEKQQMDILMEYRLSYCGYGEVNWCEALGTVLANDEVINGVSERGGYPVVKKKLRQWYLRITEYADRLLDGLEKVAFSEAMKEMQTNWIGKSSGAEIEFRIKPPLTPPKGEDKTPKYQTAQSSLYNLTKTLAEEKRKNPTTEEEILWQLLRSDKTGFHIRRQHIIGSYIVDFACLDKLATIEVDGGYHKDPEVQEYDKERTRFLKENKYTELRFTNEEVRNDATGVVKKIIEQLSKLPSVSKKSGSSQVSPLGGDLEGAFIRVYTTRPDTIFGVDFMVIAPEHELAEKITSDEQRTAVEEYIAYVKSRSERERMAEKKISGVFTGAYALNPFNGREIPIWISEYVLAGYGTGAIMAVPCGDERDHKFAKHFNIPITNIIGSYYNGEEANPTKDAVLENSDFLNGLVMRDAVEIVIEKIEELGIGKRKVNYKMRDAAFSRQRYWGEPFPIKWINGIAYPLAETELPLLLPEVDSYKPGPEGDGPLANIKSWVHQKVKLANQPESSQIHSSGGDLGESGHLETTTMPGYAGSSWYFLRYMDPHNDKEFCARTISDYWNQVDIYVGGTEHAVGHLLYSRMWTKFLFDLGYIGFNEPFKKLVNQGMIQGSSRFVYRVSITSKSGVSYYNYPIFVSFKFYREYLKHGYLSRETLEDLLNNRFDGTWKEPNDNEFDGILSISPFHVDVNIVDGHILDIEAFKKWKPEYSNAIFIKEFSLQDIDGNGTGDYLCGSEIEKMSKSKFNTVNPDDLVYKYGADTFRMYEMFLGPVEMSKPWDTKGIEGVHRFLKKLWRLFFDEIKGRLWNEEKANAGELKILHKAIKKIEEDTERFSFNTAVSAFMIAVNELTDLKCHKRSILEPLLVLLAPYAPHIAEELYHQLNSSQVSPTGGDLEGAFVLRASYPVFEEKYIAESSKSYPVAINGKTRTELSIALDATQEQAEQIVLADPIIQKWLEGKSPKKIIYVKNKMINIVI